MNVPSPTRLKLSRCTHHNHKATRRSPIFEPLHDDGIGQLYTLSSILGRGAVATVYLGLERATGQQVAVKVVRTTQLSTRQLEDLQREVRILSAVTHANVVHLVRAYKS
jgi:serine/threonine protein kinase